MIFQSPESIGFSDINLEGSCKLAILDANPACGYDDNIKSDRGTNEKSCLTFEGGLKVDSAGML
jgi:hypothetical protein